jgi:hypothetical protein
LLYSSKSLNVTHLPRLLANITCPVVLGGPTVQIHNAELLVQAKEISGLTLAHDVLSAQIELGKLGLI